MRCKPITVDFGKTLGPIKPMNAVNNGPVGDPVRQSGNAADYAALKIPYARNHDASFYAGYGGEFTVDVHRIFKNFDADENDPASYFFEATDRYIAQTEAAGTRTYYRLGAAIEHETKYGTFPPRDNLKWAKICEHIIRHYTEGWADGFHYDIEYWEVWNEPECGFEDWEVLGEDPAGRAPNNHPCWQGTVDEFTELFCVAVPHLKKAFPHLKIGGPAFCWMYGAYPQRLMTECHRRGIVLDFISYHWYGHRIKDLEYTIKMARQLFDTCGYEGVPLFLNEWNYIRGWTGEAYQDSRKAISDHRGAAFVAAAMAVGQNGPVDMLMYYDARPTTYNGLFSSLMERQPTYNTFALFRDLRALGTQVKADFDRRANIYTVAAKGEGTGLLMLSRFDKAKREPLCVGIRTLSGPFGDKVRAEVFAFDEGGKEYKVREDILGRDTEIYLTLPNYFLGYIRYTTL